VCEEKKVVPLNSIGSLNAPRGQSDPAESGEEGKKVLGMTRGVCVCFALRRTSPWKPGCKINRKEGDHTKMKKRGNQMNIRSFFHPRRKQASPHRDHGALWGQAQRRWGKRFLRGKHGPKRIRIPLKGCGTKGRRAQPLSKRGVRVPKNVKLRRGHCGGIAWQEGISSWGGKKEGLQQKIRRHQS